MFEWAYWGVWVEFWENDIPYVGPSVADTLLVTACCVQGYIQMSLCRLSYISNIYSVHVSKHMNKHFWEYIITEFIHEQAHCTYWYNFGTQQLLDSFGMFCASSIRETHRNSQKLQN